MHESIHMRFEASTRRHEPSDILDVSSTRINAEFTVLAEARTDGVANSDYPLIWMLALRTKVVLANAVAWIDPHTTFDEEETVFEWWKGDRKLSAYVSGSSVELLRVWGPDIDTEMDSIADPTTEQLLDAWRWLLG